MLKYRVKNLKAVNQKRTGLIDDDENKDREHDWQVLLYP
jgi:hypothetical protein